MPGSAWIVVIGLFYPIIRLLPITRPVQVADIKLLPNHRIRSKYQVKVIYKHNGVLTEKGKKDYVGGSSFRVSTTTFGEITGIVRNKSMNIVEVKYTVFETPTPFGVTAFNMQERTIEKTEIFRKYDDGWRIE